MRAAFLLVLGNIAYPNPDGSIYRPLKPMVSLLHIKSQLPNLLLTQLLRRAHLIQRDKPLYDLPPMIKIPLRDLVDGLNHVAQERVQGFFGGHVQLQRVEEGYEVLRRVDYQAAGCCAGATGGVGGVVRGLLDGGGHADADPFCGSWAFDLEVIQH